MSSPMSHSHKVAYDAWHKASTHTAPLPAVSSQHASGALHCTSLPQQHLCTTIAAQAGVQRSSF